jgi:hypothetical protein
MVYDEIVLIFSYNLIELDNKDMVEAVEEDTYMEDTSYLKVAFVS